VKTDKFIDLLAEDAGPGWRFGSIFRLALLVAVLIAGLIFFGGIGFRPDISQAVETVRFLFKFVVTIALAIAAIGMAWRLGRPGVPILQWRWTLMVAPVLLLCAVLAELVALPAGDWRSHMIGHNARFCLTLIPLMSVGPLGCFLFALRRGAPESPGLAGAIAGLAASGIAATFYAANCNDDSPLFVALWYPVAIALVTLAGWLAGRRLLRW
jgi:hypothetical protein